MNAVVLHGFAGASPALLRFFPGAAAPELPGHGAAPDATSWEAALDHLATSFHGPSLLFGYSMGARLALALALRHPERVERLVLESGTAGIEEPAARARRKADDEELADFIEREGMEKFVERWEEHPTLASLKPFAPQLRPERLAHRPSGLASALRHLGAGAQPSYWDELRDLDVPVLLLAGAQDEKFAGLARRMRERLPRAVLRLVPDCGHAPHLERPAAFAEALAAPWSEP
ncbi:MAG TPA: alpha/beta fold hydrolase [Myxococcales bacterium]|nr:alpha/beta fold hydrolase [Myxococcales bacterium]